MDAFQGGGHKVIQFFIILKTELKTSFVDYVEWLRDKLFSV